jgi:hypothetical protein
MMLMAQNLRQNQIANFQRASQLSEEDREKMFEFNTWAPWADKSQAIAAEKQQAAKTVNEGINTIGSAASSYLEGVQQRNDYKNYFSSPNNASYSTPDTAMGYANRNQPTVSGYNPPSVAQNFNTVSNTPMNLNFDNIDWSAFDQSNFH